MNNDDKSEKPKDGLERLREAVMSSGPIERSHLTSRRRPAAMQRAAEFCRQWQPLDTYVSFCQRHPGMDIEKTHARMLRVRGKVPGIPKKISMSPWQIATAFLASLPAAYRQSTDD